MSTTSTPPPTISKASLVGITPVQPDCQEIAFCTFVSPAQFLEVAGKISPDHKDYHRFNSYWDQRSDLLHDHLEETHRSGENFFIKSLFSCYKNSRPGSATRKRIYLHFKHDFLHLLEDCTTHEELIRRCPNVFNEIELHSKS